MRSSKLIFITTGTLLLTLTNLATGNAQIVVETLSAGEQIGVEVAMSSDPVTTTSTEHVAIPNASLSWTTRESVLIEVTLTGECRLIGGNLPGEWIEVYANISSSRPVDGFPKVLDPGSDIGSPMAFCSDDLWEAHSAS